MTEGMMVLALLFVMVFGIGSLLIVGFNKPITTMLYKYVVKSKSKHW